MEGYHYTTLEEMVSEARVLEELTNLLYRDDDVSLDIYGPYRQEGGHSTRSSLP
jgi:hypothetical protein